MSSFNKDKCRQRNRLAARRDAVDAVPMLLYRSADSAPKEKIGLRYAHGTLPASVDAALVTINAMLPDGATALTAEDVYIHYAEAANDNYIDSRFMFLHETTLRNIATDAAAGVAFLNSHKTGGMSHPAELPMGKTFAGRYEEYRDGKKRALVGIYMLRGVQPNGANGPSTDDLHKSIQSGTVFDVSVGLMGGERICDVCAKPVDGYTREDKEACQHAPGTHREMSKDQITAQKARGVKKGIASYSLLNSRMGEVSAVFDGAVPGAGFNKTLALARNRQLSSADLAEAMEAYADLLSKGDLPMAGYDELTDTLSNAFADALQRLGIGKKQAPSLFYTEDIEEMATPIQPQQPDPEIELLKTQLAAVQAERAADKAQHRLELAKKEIGGLVQAAKLYPSQNSDGQATALMAFLMAQEGSLALSNGAAVSPAEALRLLLAPAPAHNLATEAVPVHILAPAVDADKDAQKAERLAKLLSYTEAGRVAQANRNGKDN